MAWSRSLARQSDLARLGPAPWTRAQLRSLGWTEDQLERDARAGRLTRVRRGLYAPPEPGADWSVPAAYAAFVAAAPGSVVSHRSSARVVGLWLPPGADERVHLTTEGRPLRSGPSVRRHRAALPPEDVVLLDGVPFTDVPRTAVDLALGQSLPLALASLDAALGRMTLGEAWCTPSGRLLIGTGSGRERERRAVELLDAAIARAAGRNGCRALARAVPWADARSESPYESWSRGTLIEAGLVPEAVGLPVAGASGRRYWADLGWPSRRVLAEVDGLAKYGTSERSVRERLAAERHRQADLEDAGWTVVRWTAGEPGRVVVARIRRALAAR